MMLARVIKARKPRAITALFWRQSRSQAACQGPGEGEGCGGTLR